MRKSQQYGVMYISLDIFNKIIDIISDIFTLEFSLLKICQVCLCASLDVWPDHVLDIWQNFPEQLKSFTISLIDLGCFVYWISDEVLLKYLFSSLCNYRYCSVIKLSVHIPMLKCQHLAVYIIIKDTITGWNIN